MCIRPLKAHIPYPGSRPVLNSAGTLRIPCQTCHECLKIRSMDFALRSQHELAYHVDSSFLNLTYDENHVPTIEQFYKTREKFANFLKRLRKSIEPKKIKYLASHEYGGKTHRPHHHAIIFGHSFSDWKLYSVSKKGHNLYTSQELTDLWTYGGAKLGTATGASAYYIASYALKSIRHDYIDPNTGETSLIRDKMTCSRSLGFQFLIDNQNSLTEYHRLPRYYRKLLQERYELEELFMRHIQNPLKYGWGKRLKNRYQALKSLNPTLHMHYEQKMAEYTLTATEKTPHQLLASLELNEAQQQQASDFRNTKSSHDKKLLEIERLRLDKLITEN